MEHDLFEPARQPKKRRKIPFPFILEQLERAGPVTRPMFGCEAIYIGPKIVLVLRDRPAHPDDNGIWIATDRQHHESLRRDLPSLRSISIFGSGESNWQNLPSGARDFEESAMRLCEMVLAGDERIGRVPKPRKKRKR